MVYTTDVESKKIRNEENKIVTRKLVYFRNEDFDTTVVWSVWRTVMFVVKFVREYAQIGLMLTFKNVFLNTFSCAVRKPTKAILTVVLFSSSLQLTFKDVLLFRTSNIDCFPLSCSICMYVCMYVYMCVRMYLSTYICTRMYIRTCMCMHVHLYVCVFIYNVWQEQITSVNDAEMT